MMSEQQYPVQMLGCPIHLLLEASEAANLTNMSKCKGAQYSLLHSAAEGHLSRDAKCGLSQIFGKLLVGAVCSR